MLLRGLSVVAVALLWLLLPLAMAPAAQAQGRLSAVPRLDGRARLMRAMDSRFRMVDGDPTLLVADNWGSRIVRVRFDRNGRQRSEVVAGRCTGFMSFSPDGTPAHAADIRVSGLAQTSDGQILFVDTQGLSWGSLPCCVRTVGPDGLIRTVAGSGQAGAGAAGLASAQIRLGWHLGGIAVNERDEIYVADTDHDRVIKFSLGGPLEVVANTPAPGNLTLTQDDLYILTEAEPRTLRKMALVDGEISVVALGQAPVPCAISVTGRGERLLIAEAPGQAEEPSVLWVMPPESAHATRLTVTSAPWQAEGLPAEAAPICHPTAILGTDASGLLIAGRPGLLWVDRAGADGAPEAAELRALNRRGSDAAVRAGILALRAQAATEPNAESCALRSAVLDSYFRMARPHTFPPELVELVGSYENSPQAEMMRIFRARFMLNTLLSFPEFRLMPELDPGLIDYAAVAALRWYRGSLSPNGVMPPWLERVLDRMRR